MVLLLSTLEALPNSNSDSLILLLTKAIENKDVNVRARLMRIERLETELGSLKGASLEWQFDIYNALYH